MRLDKNYQEVLQELETNEDSGLTTANAKERYEKYGANALKEKKHTPFFVKFLLQFKDFLVIFAISIINKVGTAVFPDSYALITEWVVFNFFASLSWV